MTGKNYREQPSCANCKHVFVRYGYEGPELYCTLNAPPRPICMSQAMDGEYPSGKIGGRKWKRSLNDWEAWAKGRAVERNGVCDEREAVT